MRQVEIDVFADPDGGRFAHPAILQTVAAARLPADPDFDPKPDNLLEMMYDNKPDGMAGDEDCGLMSA